MAYLKIFYDKDIFPAKETPVTKQWSIRKTVKIILLNKNNEIALVTNSIHKFYLLPGGEIDNKENLWNAADRECREETGITIKKGEIIGVVKEYRARDEKIYETFGVIAYAVQNISEDLRTKDEKTNGLFFNWHTISNANKIFQNQYKLG